MTISELSRLPISFVAPDGGTAHENLLRAHPLLEKVKELLSQGTPAPVVLEIIAEVEQSGIGVSPFCCIESIGVERGRAACDKCRAFITGKSPYPSVSS